MAPEFKELKNTIKSLFSSLFSRHADYLLFAEFTDKWYFTNISPEEVLTLIPNMTHAIHEVTFHDTSVKDILLEQFPILKRTGYIKICVINSLMNKLVEGQEAALQLGEENPTIHFTGPDGLEEVGALLDEDLMKSYIKLYKDHFDEDYGKESFTGHVIDLDLTRLVRSGAAMYSITNKPSDALTSIYVVNLPLRDGINTPSYSEYIKKQKGDVKATIDVCYDNGHALRTVTRYTDSTLTVVSVQPCAMWFPIDKTHPVISKLYSL